MDFFNQDLTSLHADLVNKKLSAEELTKATFENLKQTDAKIDSFLNLNEDAALATAKALDAKGINADNVLAGIPVGVKDNIVT